MYTLATNIHLGNRPLMMAPGFDDTSSATCLWACRLRLRQKNREQYSTLTYDIMECLPGP